MTTSELSASKGGGSGQGVVEQCFMADNFAASPDARPGCDESSIIIVIRMFSAWQMTITACDVISVMVQDRYWAGLERTLPVKACETR